MEHAQERGALHRLLGQVPGPPQGLAAPLKRSLRQVWFEERASVAGATVEQLSEFLAKQDLSPKQVTVLQPHLEKLVRALLGAWQPRAEAAATAHLACLHDQAALYVGALEKRRKVKMADGRGAEEATATEHEAARAFARACCGTRGPEAAACEAGAESFLQAVAAGLQAPDLTESLMLKLLKRLFSRRSALRYQKLFWLAAGLASFALVREHLAAFAQLQARGAAQAEGLNALAGEITELQEALMRDEAMMLDLPVLKRRLQDLGKAALVQDITRWDQFRAMLRRMLQPEGGLTARLGLNGWGLTAHAALGLGNFRD
jgi:hypothetical protein